MSSYCVLCEQDVEKSTVCADCYDLEIEKLQKEIAALNMVIDKTLDLIEAHI